MCRRLRQDRQININDRKCVANINPTKGGLQELWRRVGGKCHPFHTRNRPSECPSPKNIYMGGIYIYKPQRTLHFFLSFEMFWWHIVEHRGTYFHSKWVKKYLQIKTGLLKWSYWHSNSKISKFYKRNFAYRHLILRSIL